MPLALGLPAASSQDSTVSSGTLVQFPEFDVAAIKPSSTAANNTTIFRNTYGVFRASGMSAKDLIEYAYQLRSFQIIGGPGWMARDHYDVTAKSIPASEMDRGHLDIAKRRALRDADLNRMKGLLADRFRLKCHFSTMDIPVLALVVGKGGPKFHPTPNNVEVSYKIYRGKIDGHGISMGELVDNLSSEFGRMLIDDTGLKGQYDIHLEWTPDGTQDDGMSAPSLPTALSGLGLKIVQQRSPIKILVIDQIERPSAN